jgi:hypothetical protein
LIVKAKPLNKKGDASLWGAGLIPSASVSVPDVMKCRDLDGFLFFLE